MMLIIVNIIKNNVRELRKEDFTCRDSYSITWRKYESQKSQLSNQLFMILWNSCWKQHNSIMRIRIYYGYKSRPLKEY